jgi:hypothetical protein
MPYYHGLRPRGALWNQTLISASEVGRLFAATAEEFTRGDHPAGCMISLACTHTPPALTSIREMMVEHRAFSESVMAERIRQGIADGDVPADPMSRCSLLTSARWRADLRVRRATADHARN